MTAYTLTFTLPGLPRMSNASGASRNMWVMNNERKKWRKAVCTALWGYKVPNGPLQKARLVLTRYSSVQPDPDGLVIGFKSVVDGLVDAGILANDKWENIQMPTYKWERVSPKAGHIKIEVTEVQSEPEPNAVQKTKEKPNG